MLLPFRYHMSMGVLKFQLVETGNGDEASEGNVYFLESHQNARLEANKKIDLCSSEFKGSRKACGDSLRMCRQAK